MLVQSFNIVDGAVLPRHQGLYVENAFAGSLTPGTLVYVSTHDTGTGNLYAVPKVTKADADAAAGANVAKYVVTRTILQDGFGLVYRAAVVRDLDTSAAGAAGDAWYLTTTAGVGGASAPATAASTVQRVGTVRVKSSTVGEVVFDLVSFGVHSYGNSGLLAGALSADATGRAIMADSYFNAATVDLKFATGSIGEDRLTANEVNARVISNTAQQAAGVIAAANMGIPFTYDLVVADAATGNIDFTAVPYKHKILSVRYHHVGGAGDAGNSVTLHNGTGGNAITNAMNSATDNATLLASSIDDAFEDVAANATLRAVTVRGGAAGTNSVVLTITAVRIA